MACAAPCPFTWLEIAARSLELGAWSSQLPALGSQRSQRSPIRGDPGKVRHKNDANYLAHPADTVAAASARLRQLNLCSCFSFASEIPRLPLIKGLLAIDWESAAGAWQEQGRHFYGLSPIEVEEEQPEELEDLLLLLPRDIQKQRNCQRQRAEQQLLAYLSCLRDHNGTRAGRTRWPGSKPDPSWEL